MTAIRSLLLWLAYLGIVLSSPLEFKSAPDTGIILPLADNIDYRLTEDVLPIHYDLFLKPYFEDNAATGAKAFTFDGNVKIAILKNTAMTMNNITLLVDNLDVKNWTLWTGVENPMKYDEGTFADTILDNVTDKWTIKLHKELPSQSILEINFLGYMTDKMSGFYRSYYYENGMKVWLGTTQFQQTDSRKAFPSFDEPGFKSTYRLKIDHPVDYNCISNTKPEATPTPADDGRVVTTFKMTPPMSSYLLAFIVSKYDRQKNNVDNYGVVARPDAVKANATFLALDFGQKMIDAFGKALGIDYYSMTGIEKMDTAAIPDFSAGAMENWGLLTYRETLSLYYPDDTPSLNEQRIIAVIAHEQAHQWFGDLVTCKWWSETWLNEGHARYFQYFGTEMVQKEWDLEQQFVVENHQQSMQLDSTDSTHPMTDNTIASQAQSSGMFDNISYNKAASIIRMMSYYLTSQEKFYDTLKKYLSDNKYKAVVPDDYFTAYTTVNPMSDVGTVFSTWSQSVGFPMVTVKVEGKNLTLTQKRFKQSNGIQNDHNDLYNLPITYAIDSDNYVDTKPKFVFRTTDGVNKTFEMSKEVGKYIILNVQQTGYYRVNYDGENWKNIRTALYSKDHDKIHVMNRAQIVDDLFQFARAGTVDYATAMDIIQYIKDETNYIPWLSAINFGLTYLSQRVKKDKRNQELFSAYIQDTMSKIYDHLEFREPSSKDRRTDIYNRANILTWACKYGHEGCIKKSQELFAEYRKGTKINKDIRAVVYCNGIRYGNESDFNYLFDKYQNENILQEQLNIVAGTACTKDQNLANKYLDRLLKTDDIRPQDWAAANSNLLNANPESIEFFYKYVTTNHAAWKAKFDGLGILTSIAGRFTSIEEFDTYEKFLNDNKAALGDSIQGSLLSSMNRLKTTNLDWDEKRMKEFMKYLDDNYEVSGASMSVFPMMFAAITVTVLYIFN